MLLSVGYSACHWCHVMAHESFADESVAAYLNEHFVSVKVDREERPDIDAVYMEAVQAATGHGGWPMTVFLTPEAEPFYFGTYFPPEPRHGMPGFRQVLEGVVSAWADRRGEVGEAAGRIVRELAGRSLSYDAPRPPGNAELHAALIGLTREFDAVRGGFGGAPKFPPSMVLDFLLRHHARTSSKAALQMVQATCEAMARGGIYDQLGGGFARYSVDAAWVVPHFEKMLHDNALLCRVYAHLWRATGSDLARRVALETADFMVRELRTEQGGFASALDADSPVFEDDPAVAGAADGGAGEAGAASGGERAARGGGLLHVDPEPVAAGAGGGRRRVGRRVLRRDRGGDVRGGRFRAAAAGRPAAVGPEAVDSVRRRLLAARAERPRPERDDKVIAAWNGLAIVALAETGAYFDRPDLTAAAVEAADLLVRVHLDYHGRLTHTSRDGTPGDSAGVLEDYADVAEGFLTLSGVTGEGVWVEFAGLLLDTVLRHFTADDGTFFDTADDAETLIRRPQDPTDNAVPSGWTAAAGRSSGTPPPRAAAGTGRPPNAPWAW